MPESESSEISMLENGCPDTGSILEPRLRTRETFKFQQDETLGRRYEDAIRHSFHHPKHHLPQHGRNPRTSANIWACQTRKQLTSTTPLASRTTRLSVCAQNVEDAPRASVAGHLDRKLWPPCAQRYPQRSFCVVFKAEGHQIFVSDGTLAEWFFVRRSFVSLSFFSPRGLPREFQRHQRNDAWGTPRGLSFPPRISRTPHAPF